MADERNALERQIDVEIEKLAMMVDGSDEKSETINGIVQLVNANARIAEVNHAEEMDYQHLADARIQAEAERNNALAATILNGIGTIGSLATFVGFTIAGFNYEKTGSLISTTFRNVWSKLPLRR